MNTKFLAALYTIGATLLLLDILVWMMEGEGVVVIATCAALEVILVITGTVMAFNKRTKMTKNRNKIIRFFLIMVAQALVALTGFIFVYVSFWQFSGIGNGLLMYLIVALRATLVALASLLIITMETLDDYDKCPRVHSIARIVVAISGVMGVFTRCIYHITKEYLVELPFTMISWVCISGILIGIVLGYTLKVNEPEAKFV